MIQEFPSNKNLVAIEVDNCCNAQGCYESAGRRRPFSLRKWSLVCRKSHKGLSDWLTKAKRSAQGAI